MTVTRDQVAAAIADEGFIVVRDVLTRGFVADARRELMTAIEADSRKYGARAQRDYAMVMLCSLYGGSFLELFENDGVMEPFNAVLGDECIVYAYTSSSMPPQSGNYSVRVHTDCPRIVPGYVTNMGATILLDDFTEANGATWYLPRSQWRADAPPEEEFYASASRLIAPAGSVLFFNARLWHAGGQNQTDQWRHALTINMCRPYMKQRIDIPRAMAAMDLAGVGQKTLQKLGFFAQPPASLEEYYLPPEQRSFRQPVR